MKYLYENQTILDDLALHIKNNATLHPYFESSFGKIKPKNYCGFLHVEDDSYFIVPKISTKERNLDIFIYMLVYAYDVKLSNDDVANLKDDKHKIFEIFIRHFSDKLLSEFKKGVFKEYVTLQENLKVLRGKYLIDKNFTNFYHQNIYCEYDEFSLDNELNRFFLYAIKIFKKFSSYPNLARCEMILEEVSFLHVNLDRLHVNFNKLNKRYKQSYELALIILKKLIPLTSKKKNQSFAFLFDMSEVFERFIGRIYKDIDKNTKLQTQKNFGNLQLKPDIITSDCIVDTKYKKLNSKDDISAQDKYQMFAYGTNFEQKNTMLLYPKHLLHVEKDLKLGKDEKMVNLKVKTVDLDSEKKFDEYIKEMKKRVEGLR